MSERLDLHREAARPESGPVSASAIERHLACLADHAARQTALLERLVALGEAQHARENFLEVALEHGAGTSATEPLSLKNIDFMRTADLRFLVRENGEWRDPTPAEAAILATTVGGGRDRRESRR